MNETIIANMLNLTDTLARKSNFRGPELTAYLRALTFSENYFTLTNMVIQDQIRKMEDENSVRDKESSF